MFALKGNLIYAPLPFRLFLLPDFYLVCSDGKVEGTYEFLPPQYEGIEVIDCSGKLIVPGLVDTHVHAAQYANKGAFLDRDLITWLNTVTFPEELRTADGEYAGRLYAKFAEDLKASSVTRAVVYSSIYAKTTRVLMDELEKTGLVTMVGKICQDENSPMYYCESTDESLEDTENWVKESLSRYTNTSPVITPRFAPACSETLMKGLSDIAEKYDLPVTSHLSETEAEVKWVKTLFPEDASYTAVYDRMGLLRPGRTIMAHCIHLDEAEKTLLLEKGVYVAHCPESNTNLASGVMKAKEYLQRGFMMGLGSDISGGSSLCGFDAMRCAIDASKHMSSMIDKRYEPLTFTEAFFMATRGGGQFFGKVGSFEPGFEFDALVLDDPVGEPFAPLDPVQRLIRLVMTGEAKRAVVKKYCRGQCVYTKERN